MTARPKPLARRGQSDFIDVADLPQAELIVLKLVAFDFGHTLLHERAGADIPLERRPIHLMPDVVDTLAAITLPMAVWANIRVEGQDYVRRWLTRAGIDRYFSHIVTFAEAGVRKPGVALRTIAEGVQTRSELKLSHVGVRRILSGERRIDATGYGDPALVSRVGS